MSKIAVPGRIIVKLVQIRSQDKVCHVEKRGFTVARPCWGLAMPESAERCRRRPVLLRSASSPPRPSANGSPHLDGSSLLGVVRPACKSASCDGRRVPVLRGHRQPCLAQPGLNSPPRSRGRAAASYGSTVRLQGFRKPGLVDTLIDTGSTRSHCQDPGQLSVFSLLPFWVDFFFGLVWFVVFSNGHDSALPCCSPSFLVSE